MENNANCTRAALYAYVIVKSLFVSAVRESSVACMSVGRSVEDERGGGRSGEGKRERDNRPSQSIFLYLPLSFLLFISFFFREHFPCVCAHILFRPRLGYVYVKRVAISQTEEKKERYSVLSFPLLGSVGLPFLSVSEKRQQFPSCLCKLCCVIVMCKDCLRQR